MKEVELTALRPLILSLSILFLILNAGLVRGQLTIPEQDELEKLKEDRAAKEYEDRDATALDGVIDPEAYIVGPGDLFTIVFTGKMLNKYDVEVAPEGVLLVPEYGAVGVAELTLSAAKARLLSALRSRYTDVAVSVYLTKVRNVKVSVSGEVLSPGIYVLSAGDRVSEAIRRAGESLPTASDRNIMLIRNGRTINVDLMKYRRAASGSSNPYLSQGDVIVVPALERYINRVGIFGGVRSQGTFEYCDGDNLADLLMLAYGLTTDADSSSCEIVRFESDRKTTKTIEVLLPMGGNWLDSAKATQLMPDDRVYFRSHPDYHKSAQVQLLGEVRYPGYYPIIEDSSMLSDLVARAGGLTELASLSEASMDRVGFESLEEGDLERQLKLSANELDIVEKEYLSYESADRPGRVSVDFWRLFVARDSTFDIRLKDGDRIQIPRLSRTVRVIGKVLRPGLVEFEPGRDAKYYITKAGGYGWKADKGKVTIVKSASGVIAEPSKEIPIEEGDAVVVPEKLDRDWWKLVKDVGAFLADLATVYIVIDQVTD